MSTPPLSAPRATTPRFARARAAGPVWTVPPAPGAAPVAPCDSAASVRDRIADALRARGVGPDTLMSFSVAFAATATFLFVLDHPGIAAVLGALALLAGEVSLAPAGPEIRDASGLARALNPLVDLLMTAGLVVGLASHLSQVGFVLGMLVLVIGAWLPLLRALSGPTRMAADTGLWLRGERMGVLLAGAALGRLVPALAALALVGAFDAWLRVERLGQPPGFVSEIEPRLARQVLRPDGAFRPAWRWGSLGVLLVLLVLLPTGAEWRF